MAFQWAVEWDWPCSGDTTVTVNVFAHQTSHLVHFTTSLRSSGVFLSNSSAAAAPCFFPGRREKKSARVNLGFLLLFDSVVCCSSKASVWQILDTFVVLKRCQSSRKKRMYLIALVAIVLCILFKLLNVNNSPERSIFYCENKKFLDQILKHAPSLSEPWVPLSVPANSCISTLRFIFE